MFDKQNMIASEIKNKNKLKQRQNQKKKIFEYERSGWRFPVYAVDHIANKVMPVYLLPPYILS